ncbi:beta-lactamase/transpeptidase-like protein [Microdochium bolleyi]|uniref:Beta-lactamase/transpeptidase-like protein n=1 Tax=Microdochium bolleyi TaxID=196109 RepID=A0A136IPU0_9PEZI|nr:beta-lactamase/transpeptidase-like protein [Microdochium bolleyi]
MPSLTRTCLLAGCLHAATSHGAGHVPRPGGSGYDHPQVVLGEASTIAHEPAVNNRNSSTRDWSELAGFIDGFIREWRITGLSVAIRDGNEDETWAQGFGYADRSTMEPMTPHTMTFTGSTTKSFTAAALSVIVDRPAEYHPAMNWTTPIAQLLPGDDFVLADDDGSWATQHITVEDALAHRTGLPGHDLAWVPTTRDLVRGLRHLPLSAEPRTRFQYSNKMYGVLGYVIEKLSRVSLGEFLKTKIWTPLGMEETFLGLEAARASKVPLARCYHWSETLGRHVEVPYELNPADAAAGDVVSNVLDYTKYLQIMIAEEGCLLSKQAIREIKRPRMLAKESHPLFTGPVFYSLGWYYSIFRGEQVWFHTGQTADFLSIMVMVPAKKFSVVVFVNQGERAFEVVAYRVLYDLFGVPEEERMDLNAKVRTDKQQERALIKNCPAQIYPSLPSPPLPPARALNEYAGVFEHPGYGWVKLELDTSSDKAEKRRLRLTRRDDAYPHITVDLVHQSGEQWLGWMHYGEWQDAESPLRCVRAEFHADSHNETVRRFGIDLRLEGPDTPLVWYERVETATQE